MGLFDLFRRARPPTSPAAAPILPTVTEEAIESAHRVVDQVALLHPQADGEVFLVAECHEGAIQIQQMEVSALKPEAPPKILAVESFTQLPILAHEVGGLLHALGQPLRGWSATSMHVGPSRVSLLGVELPIDAERRLFGDAFMGQLGALGSDVEARQQVLQQAMAGLGPRRTDWDRARRQLRLLDEAGSATNIPADIVGSFSARVGSWCWAWANSSFDAVCSRAITEARDGKDGSEPLAVLKSPGLPCSESFAFTLAYLGAARMGARPVWRWPLANGVQLFFAMSAPERWSAGPVD